MFGLYALVMRLRMRESETSERHEARDTGATPAVPIWRRMAAQPLAMARVVLLTCGLTVVYYVWAVSAPAFAISARGVDAAGALAMSVALVLIAAGAAIGSALYAELFPPGSARPGWACRTRSRSRCSAGPARDERSRPGQRRGNRRPSAPETPSWASGAGGVTIRPAPTYPGPVDAGRDDEGGDPACWLSRVCPECGLFAVSDPPTTCERCGEAIPAPP